MAAPRILFPLKYIGLVFAASEHRFGSPTGVVNMPRSQSPTAAVNMARSPQESRMTGSSSHHHVGNDWGHEPWFMSHAAQSAAFERERQELTRARGHQSMPAAFIRSAERDAEQTTSDEPPPPYERVEPGPPSYESLGLQRLREVGAINISHPNIRQGIWRDAEREASAVPWPRTRIGTESSRAGIGGRLPLILSFQEDGKTISPDK